MKITHTNSSNSTANAVTTDSAKTVSVVKYYGGCLDGYEGFPGILPKMSRGDILLLYVDGSVIDKVLNLTYCQFDSIDIE